MFLFGFSSIFIMCKKDKYKLENFYNNRGVFMRKCGILVHPISFPSKYGIGDIGYGKKFVDFLEKGGQKLWQILPLGHTGFGDSPYQSFSTFAGNPLLISPDILVEEGLLTEEDVENVPEFKTRRIEYGKVIDHKYKLYRKAFLKFDFEDKDYKKFLTENEFWLEDYALFMACKNYFIESRKNTYESGEYRAYYKAACKYMDNDSVKDCFYGGAWNSFPKGLRNREEDVIKAYKEKLSYEIDFYKFIQYEFYSQWTELKDYANEKNIEIIGDIPIFVAGDSSDTWSRKELFYINSRGFQTKAAGVPPDYFSKDGQLWGNPLYNWKKHREEGYSWWSLRIKNTLKLADIVRIDHFRGFESYWSVPMGEETAVNGKWVKGPGSEIFEAIEKKLGKVNIIAEDLGDLNEEVIKLRDKLGLPGMKILQFAFDNCENEYLPHNYEKDNYIVYTGTHDNDTTIGWYSEQSEKDKDYIRRYMNVSGEFINWDLIRLAVSSCGKYSIIPIQDIIGLGSDARMNIPGKSEGNWQFRFEENDLNEKIADKLKYLCELFNR